MTVIPAFGRDYTTSKAALADWDAGKDFIIQDISSRWDGKPINKRDAKKDTIPIMIRYNGKADIIHVP